MDAYAYITREEGRGGGALKGVILIRLSPWNENNIKKRTELNTIRKTKQKTNKKDCQNQNKLLERYVKKNFNCLNLKQISQAVPPMRTAAAGWFDPR